MAGHARVLKVPSQGQINLYDSDNSAKLILKAAAVMGADYTITFPAADAVGYLKSDGAGNFTWAAASASLDGAYDVGRSITVDAGKVALTGSAGLGEEVLGITQGAAASPALKITGGTYAIDAAQSLLLANDKSLYIKQAGGTAISSVTITAGDIMCFGSPSHDHPLAYFVGNSYQVWYANGSERMRLTAGGKLGIGIDPPQDFLEVYDSSTNAGINLRGPEGVGNRAVHRFCVGSGAPATANTVSMVRSTITAADPDPLAGKLTFWTNQGDSLLQAGCFTEAGAFGVNEEPTTARMGVTEAAVAQVGLKITHSTAASGLGIVKSTSGAALEIANTGTGPDIYAFSRNFYKGTAAPVTGSWGKGDTVLNSDPDATEYYGWVCTVAGSPGTWKGFGAIQA